MKSRSKITKEIVRTKKKTVCMPTHLPEDVALHIAQEAYERGWSNSGYLRWLAMEDMDRCEDGKNLMAEVSGIPRERFDLFEQTKQSVRNERNKKA
ncbi:hypothetical protein P256_00036 [Acinetobacter nectaris CIP 110549]|uniref:Uncharacterized protein n=1 Tax=Acinetobacter nectaris CIP 110549 TaxID=1392540 RepID=V2TSX4_9GAMM|nr:hypothetical protein [Acinetobacter nectaris]ESK41051.1 hypothetical protein P256_00036 [Acinetobacter nectaris CIP 110549]